MEYNNEEQIWEYVIVPDDACSFLLARQSLTQVAWRTWRYTHVEETLGPTTL